MARVVKVDLVLEATRYLRGARDAGDATDKLADTIDDVARTSDKATKSTENLGGGLDDLAGDARQLDSQIDKTKRGIRDLAREIARTSDEAQRAELSKKLNVEQRSLRKQTKLRDLIDVDSAADAGGDAAEKFSVQFAQRLGPLVARAPMGGPGAIIGGAMAVAAVPTLAAAIQGAVVGGIGIGGVIGGVALASKDARVQAAGKTLGENLLGDLEDSASRFVEPTLAGIGSIQAAWDDVSGDIDGALAAASRYVEPLADGVGNFMRELAPGIRDAAEAAGPIIDVISQELPEIGAVLSDMLSDFADNADSGASALRLIFMILEDGIAVVGGAITMFGSWYRTMVDVADAATTVAEVLFGWNPLFSGQIESARAKVDAMKGDLDRTGNAGGEAGEKIAGGLQKVPPAADTAAAAVQTLADAVLESTDRAMASERANIALGEAINRATEAGKANNAGISANTPKALANRSALLGIADAAKAASADILKNTRNHELAAKATERGRTAFLKAADAMNVEKGQAIALANKLFGIPNIKRSVSVNTAQANGAIAALKARIASIDRRIDIKAVMTTSYAGSYHSGQGYTSGQRWGGAYEHARDGLVNLREAGIYSPAGPARYAFAEPATGGEAFIPKYGDRDRSLDILSTAARWYGQQVGPMSRAAAPTQAAPQYSPVQLAAAVRAALAGVTVQMDGRAVGVIQGRQADMYSRGA